jgi:intein/homing endonuclease
MKPKKILCLFDYVARTGFGTVSKNIVQEIKKHYGEKLKLDIIAINYFGEPYEEDNINVISARRNDVNDDPYGRYFFLKVLKENKDYDGVFICQDLGVIVPFIEIMQHIKAERKENNEKSFKSIFYFPVDCHIIYELTRNLEFFDLLVTYTEFGRKEVLKFKPELKTKLKVLPHGNNSKDFYPLPEDEKIKFRKEFFGENADKFIVTNVNRNQPRKDIPNTIFGFVEATKNWDKDLPKPFLYLHMHPNDPMGWDIRAILMQTDLKEDIDYKIYPKEFEEMGADVSVVNKIYNASDVYITTTLGEGWGLCLSPYSKILTSNGVVEIKNVKIGDEVMTNDGNFQKVLDTTSRKIDSYIEIKTKYGYKLEATHEHPYYSLVNGKEKYRKVEDLKLGDYLAIVKQNQIKDLPKKIDLLDYLPNKENWNFNFEFIYHKFGYSPKSKKWSISNICKEYSTTKKVVENAIAYITGKKEKVSENVYSLANNLIANGFDKPQPLKIKRFIEINEDVLWVFGWYLAEGSCEGGKRLEFSMGIDEVEDANKIAKIIKLNFGIKDITVRVFDNKCAVRVSNVALSLIFKELFGNGAYNKRVPEFLFSYPKNLMPLVDGYIKGDGHINLNIDQISFTSISPSLAYQMQSILATNGIMLSINKSKRGLANFDIYNCKIPSFHLRKYMDLVKINGKLDRESKRNHRPDFIETDTHFFVPITSIKEIKKEDEFYDLCVDNSHSFIANGIVCHNTYSEAASCKIPIVAPYTTSFMEMSGYGKNAYMLENIYPICQTIDNVIREHTDIYEIADNLLHIAKIMYGEDEGLNLKEEMKKKIENSYNWIKKLEWNIVCKQWIDYFKIY